MILNPKFVKNPGINFRPGINTLQGADFRKTYSPDWEVTQILPIWNDFGQKTCTYTHKPFDFCQKSIKNQVCLPQVSRKSMIF